MPVGATFSIVSVARALLDTRRGGGGGARRGGTADILVHITRSGGATRMSWYINDSDKMVMITMQVLGIHSQQNVARYNGDQILIIAFTTQGSE